MIRDAPLETDGDDFRIELDISLAVALEGYEFPIVDLLAIMTSEVAAIAERFAPAFD